MMVDTQVATGVDCKSMVSDFAGSSPARPTIYMLGWRTRSAQWSEKPPTMVQLHPQAPFGPIAQWLVQRAHNSKAIGSSPIWSTTFNN